MKINSVFFILFFSQILSKSVVTKFSINQSNNARPIEEELLKIVAKNREYKAQLKNITQQNNELNEKIDNEIIIINIKSNGLFFENKSMICDSNDLSYQKFIISSIIKKKIRSNLKYFYSKKMKLINMLIEKYNKNTITKKFKKVTFNKKRTHKSLVYNLELCEKLLQLENNEQIKNKLTKIKKFLKKQLLFYYLNKQFKKSDIFSTEFDSNELKSKKKFIKWVNNICKNSNFNQIIQQAKRS